MSGDSTPVIDPVLLELIVCPETRQKLELADGALLDSIHTRIAAGRLKTRGGDVVESAADGVLVRADRQVAYLITDQIPDLVVDSGIPLSAADEETCS